MARKIVFETEVNQTGFTRGLAMMEARAEAANGRMTRTMYEHNKRMAARSASEESRAITERRARLAALTSGEGFTHGGIAPASSARGGWRARLGVAGNMFTSVARDSAASLASGAPITQVIAQQGPQVLQALAMMKAGMLAWTAVVAGAAVYAWNGLTKAIGEAVYQNAKFVGQAAYYEKSAEALRKIRYELEDLTKAENTAEARAIEREKRRKESADKALEANREWERQQLDYKLIRQEQFKEINPAEAERQRLDLERKFLEEDLAKLDQNGPESSARVLELKNQLVEAQRVPEEENSLQKMGREILVESIKKDLEAAAAVAASDYATQRQVIDNKLQANKNAKERTYGKSHTEQAIKGSSLIPGDSLVSSGNFLGSTRGRIDNTAVAQLAVQRQSLGVLKEIKNQIQRPGGGSYPVV